MEGQKEVVMAGIKMKNKYISAVVCVRHGLHRTSSDRMERVTLGTRRIRTAPYNKRRVRKVNIHHVLDDREILVIIMVTLILILYL
jgi:hypothetical protein